MPRNLSNGFIKLAVLLKLSDFLTARTSVSLSAFFLQGSETRGQSNSLLRGKLWPGKVLENFHDTLKFQGGKEKRCHVMNQDSRHGPMLPKVFCLRVLMCIYTYI